MKRKMTVAMSSAMFVGLVSTVFLAFGPSSAQAQPADPTIVVTLRGLGLPVDVHIPGVDTPGDCLETDLFNTRTDTLIGTGIDCIDIEDTDGVNFLVNRTTIFNFHQGTLVANGPTTVVSIFGASSPDFTHVVGDADASDPNIIFGTKRFAGATGNVRLSGIVNLADFPNTVGFNCIFVIDLN
jgi:hypothetical protein